MTLSVTSCTDIAEAARVLARDREARFLGGGTLLMRAVNEGDQSFSTLVRVPRDALRRVHGAGDRVEIGAGVTMAEVLEDRTLDFLHGAARGVGGPAVRSMATVGGNLFAPSPYGDFSTALLALDATVTLAGQSGAGVALSAFLAERDREPRSIVASVSVRRPDRGAFRFVKVSRVKPKGVPVLCIAAHLPTSGGRVAGARVAYGAMAATPIRVLAVERALEGRSLDEAGIAAAVAAAAEGLDPPTDAIASGWYRSNVAPVHLKRLLLGRAG
jgi:CO/xanthine dehydrogenase FAD-binding subunit